MTRRQTAGAVRHRSAELRHNWQKAPPGMTPDPCDREFRSIQVEHAGSAECILRRSMRGGCSAGLRPAPATSWSNSNSRSWFPVGSRGGSGCGGRCKYVHVARSPHPCGSRPRNRTHPAFDRSLRSVDPRHSWMNLCRISKSIGGQIRFPTENGSDPKPFPMPSPGPIQPSPGNCRRQGGVGLRGVRGMDAAAKPPWTGLRRPRNPTPPCPTHRQPRAVLALALALALAFALAGAGRSPADPPSPAHENDFTVFSKPSSLRHASIILRSSMRPRATHAKKRPPIA